MFRPILEYPTFLRIPSSWIRRRSSSSDTKKAATIKYLNFANKALYGKVIETKRVRNSDPEPASTRLETSSSEMYWMLQHQPSTPFTFDSVDRLVGAENKKKSKSKKVDERQIAIFDDREAGITMKPKKLKVATRSPRALLASSNVSLNQISPRPEIRVQKMTIKKQSEIKEPKIVGQEMRIEQKKSKRLPFIQKDHNVPQPRVFKPMPTRTDKLLDILTVPVFGLANRNSAEPTEIVGTERLEMRQMPSVGKVLQATMPDSSRRALMKWKLTKIAELGEDGFNELQRSNLSAGSKFHSALQTYFQTKEQPDVASSEAKIWASVEPTLQRIDSRPELVEAPIVHPMLQYKGIVDCVSKVDNHLSVIEWKKSELTKSTITSTYDAPLQLCAYLGAINADPRYTLDEVRAGLVVVAYPSGGPANAFRLDEIDVQKYWRAWLMRLHEYWVRHRDGTLPEPI